jgi:hypothetical protein
MLVLVAFVTQLISFFEELSQSFPEEKDIRMALEAIRGARKVNPRLILDLFYEHVYADLHEAIQRQDIDTVQSVARSKITTQFNEIMPALALFDKHWSTMSDTNKEAIWKYLKVLCVLCEKARSS